MPTALSLVSTVDGRLLSSVLWLADQSFAAELTELLQLHTSRMSFLMIGSWRLTSISSEHRFYLQRADIELKPSYTISTGPAEYWKNTSPVMYEIVCLPSLSI
ncbi:hypothetical protein ACOSQ2_030429 [Xanthoceras sorbifolium]